MFLMKKLHEQLGLKNHSPISKWRNRHQEVAPKYAKKLEQLTGIDRRRFVWPDEFGDPWEELKLIYNHKIMRKNHKGYVE